MDRAEATAPGGDAASRAPSGRRVGERERRLEEREHRVAEREHEADEREHEADDREREADEREHEADEREHEADEREHEAQLRQRAVELRARAASVREEAAQAVAQAEIVLDACRDRVRRAEAALNRAYARAARERASDVRSATRGEQHPPPRQHDFTDLVGRFSALRKRTAAAAAQLAETEEQSARMFDDLSARGPGNPEHQRLANEAREAVRRAREIERKYSSS